MRGCGTRQAEHAGRSEALFPSLSAPAIPCRSLTMTLRVKSSSPSKAGPVSTTVRHECTIELSSKVIDTELKLRNTLAHELCHIAAWILSGEIRPPHGGAFKLW